jgi:tetratricopeptide (TPR) repeat protein
VSDGHAKLPGPQAGKPLEGRPASAPPDRLESWKEIAAYLKRGLSTVQRWEKQEGLPVYRLQHDKGSTVFAYRAELDAWWHSGHSQLRGDEEEEKPPPEATAPLTVSDNGDGRAHVGGQEPEAQLQPASSRRRRLMWLAGTAVALVVLAAAVVYRLVPRPSVPLRFQSHDTVLIASFDNRTGESLFDGTVEAALSRELTNSRFASVAPRARIDDTLALMRKPANTRVDAALGREICLRDGGIRSMITGRIDKLGPTYLLGAQLVDPTSGRTVASFEEEASGQAAILPAVHRLSDSVRKALGEATSQIRRSDAALQKVTTPSLKALQLYTQANEELAEGKYSTALELLRQAIAEDRDFASSYLLAAYALANQGKPAKEVMPYAKRALELSPQASEPERYFIEASYYQFTHQADKAIAAYQALLRVDPGSYWGAGNLGDLYRGSNLVQQAVDTFVESAELRPNSFDAQMKAAYYLAIVADNPDGARPYIDRANTLLSEMSAGARSQVPEAAMWVHLYPAYRAWMRDDIALAETELAQAEKQPIEHDTLAEPRDFGCFSLALGQARKAEAWFRMVSRQDPLLYDSDLVILRYARGDHAALRSSLREMARLPEQGIAPVSLMIHEGLLHEADESAAIRWYPKQVPDVELLRGELLLAKGRTDQGVSLLRRGLDRERGWAVPIYFLGAESLARAYERQGNTSAAVRTLEEASANRARVNFEVAMAGAPFWMQDQMELARLYRRLGRVQDAQKIEGELRKLLTYADPDFPLLVELKKLQKAPNN